MKEKGPRTSEMKNKRQIATRWICVITKSSILIQIGYSTRRIDKKRRQKLGGIFFSRSILLEKKIKGKQKKRLADQYDEDNSYSLIAKCFGHVFKLR